MAETLIAPGIIARENDSTLVTEQPVVRGMAIIGPTVKGPVEVPTVVTSYSDFENKFGSLLISGGLDYTYFTSIAAYDFFEKGGQSLLVARVVTGSYTPANATVYGSDGSASFEIETISEGEIMNSTSSQSTTGALQSGSKDNIRWEVAGTNSGSGTFSIIVRQGNDRTANKITLETWNNLSLDPRESNYISNVIGDQVEAYNTATNQIEIVSGSYTNASRYIRVKSVTRTTPDYFDNDGNFKPAYTGSIPNNQSGSFGNATGTVKGGAKFYKDINSTDTQGLTGGCYTSMINLLSNREAYQYAAIVTPGIYKADHSSEVTALANNVRERGDALYALDTVNYASGTLNGAVTEASGIDNNYATTYWPWVQVLDPTTGRKVWVPASTIIPGVFAYSDKVSERWFAPAGLTRGSLRNITGIQQKLNTSAKETLYSNNVNPIGIFAGQGIAISGQKTLQKANTSLNRINVRRLLIEVKNYITQVGNTMLFDNNTTALRTRFKSIVNPYMESVKQREGFYKFMVKMDESNNTPDTIARHELKGYIYLQPTIAVEYIYFDFNITPSGVEFS